MITDRKPFLVQTSTITWGASDWKVYTLDADGKYYMADDGIHGYSVAKIEQHPNAGWNFFDSREESNEWIKQYHWKKKHSFFIPNASQSPTADSLVICDVCDRGYEPKLYSSDEGDLFVASQIHTMQCYCNRMLQYEVQMTMTIKQES